MPPGRSEAWCPFAEPMRHVWPSKDASPKDFAPPSKPGRHAPGSQVFRLGVARALPAAREQANSGHGAVAGNAAVAAVAAPRGARGGRPRRPARVPEAEHGCSRGGKLRERRGGRGATRPGVLGRVLDRLLQGFHCPEAAERVGSHPGRGGHRRGACDRRRRVVVQMHGGQGALHRRRRRGAVGTAADGGGAGQPRLAPQCLVQLRQLRQRRDRGRRRGLGGDPALFVMPQRLQKRWFRAPRKSRSTRPAW